jgi:hypothetical protein
MCRWFLLLLGSVCVVCVAGCNSVKPSNKAVNHQWIKQFRASKRVKQSTNQSNKSTKQTDNQTSKQAIKPTKESKEANQTNTPTNQTNVQGS